MLGNLTVEIASDETLEAAYLWLCDRRKNYSHNDEVWQVRYRWAEIKPQLQRQLHEGGYLLVYAQIYGSYGCGYHS